MTTQQRVLGPGVITRQCESTTVSEGAVLVVGAADNNVALPSGADITAGIVGLAKSSLTAAGPVDIVLPGNIFPGIASGSISRGDKLAVADNTGKVKTASIGAGTNTMIVGTALAAAADGERVSMSVDVYLMQG